MGELKNSNPGKQQAAAMRIKTGSWVEVWCTEEGPMGAWRSGQVQWGDGHFYGVCFDYIPEDGARSRWRIPGDCVRPCPPFELVSEDWGVGDMAEVFDDYSWKCVEVMEVEDDPRFFSVKIVGSSRVLRVRGGMLRTRRIRKDNGKWAVARKEKQRPSGLAARSCAGKHGKCDGGRVGEDGEVRATVSGTARKKRSHGQMDAAVVPRPRVGGIGKRLRVEEEDVRSQWSIAGRPPELPARSPGMVLEKLKAITGYDCKDGDAGTVSSSVGSCSFDSKCASPAPRDPNCAAIDARTVSSSDGSSSSRSISASAAPQDPNGSQHQNSRSRSHDRAKESLVGRKKISDEKIHLLELEAYNSTIAALYASGPLSWEKVELLTNLRLMLHISSDEHLQVINELISCSAKEFLCKKI